MARAQSSSGATDRRSVLDELWRAERDRPDAPLLRWRGHDGRVVEHRVADVAEQVRRGASWLRSLGVAAGDHVATFATNHERLPSLWCAIHLVGAVEVPINAHLKGFMLQHVLDDARPAVVVADAERRAVLAAASTGATVVPLEDVAGWDRAEPAERADPPPTALATIMYTSGTTGPSKGVMLPHGYAANLAARWGAVQALAPGDVSHFSLPMFHVDSHVAFACALVTGSTLGVVPRFSATRFWDECRDLDATWFVGVGAMMAAIARRPVPDDVDRLRLRRGVGAPIPDEAYERLEDALGISLFQLYGQTEADGVCFETVDRRRRGSAGWPSTGFEVAVVDDLGAPLPPGATGEIVYRPGAPNMMAIGYWNRPEATAAAVRDLWFHSGDLGSFDADGFLWFRGRKRDSLRRRGENISAFELEQTVRGAPGVAECAAVGVPDPLGGEDEVKVFVVLRPGERLDPAAFFAYCEDNLARFAVPRFVEVVDESALVRGPGTGAIQKHLLPAAPGPGAIDRQEVAR